MGIIFMGMYRKHGKTGNCREDEYRGKWITGGEGREREREEYKYMFKEKRLSYIHDMLHCLCDATQGSMDHCANF